MKSTRKVLSIVLSVILVLGVLPVAVSAAGITVSSVGVNFDINNVLFNTACSGNEFYNGMRLGSSAVGAVFIDWANSYPIEGNSSISYSDELLNASEQYRFCWRLKLNSGYDWIEGVKSISTSTAVTDVDGFSVSVNGVVRNDVEVYYSPYWNDIMIYVPVGTPSTSPIVKSIAIDGDHHHAVKANSLSLTATVVGNVTDKSVTWSIAGNHSAATTINSAGRLTVGADETAYSIGVTATSKADPTKKATISVMITDEPLYISSIVVSTVADKLYPRETRWFYADVQGTEIQKGVVWSVIGAKSSETKIDYRGILEVGFDETATSLKIKATSVKYPDKYGLYTIAVTQNKMINEICIDYDEGNIKFCEGFGAETFRNSMFAAMTLSDGVYMDYECEYNSVLLWNSQSCQFDSYILDSSQQYMFDWNMNVARGYDWSSAIKGCAGALPDGVTVKVNGVVRKDAQIYYNSYWNLIDIFVPIGAPAKATLDTVKGVLSTTFTGASSIENIIPLSEAVSLVSSVPSVSGAKNYYGTGSTFTLAQGGSNKAYTLVVKSDINGDSFVDVLDLTLIERQLNHNSLSLSAAQTAAMDANSDDAFTAADYSASVNAALK